MGQVQSQDVYLVTRVSDAYTRGEITQHLLPATPALDAYLYTHTRRKANEQLILDLADFSQVYTNAKQNLKNTRSLSSLLDMSITGLRYGRTAESDNAEVDMLINHKIAQLFNFGHSHDDFEEEIIQGRFDKQYNVVGSFIFFSSMWD